MLTHPVTLYWHRADQLFCVPHFIVSTMQAGTTSIFKVFGMNGPSTNRESKPQNLLVGARFTISRGYWGPICHQGAPSGAPTPHPHGIQGHTCTYIHTNIWSIYIHILYMYNISHSLISSEGKGSLQLPILLTTNSTSPWQSASPWPSWDAVDAHTGPPYYYVTIETRWPLTPYIGDPGQPRDQRKPLIGIGCGVAWVVRPDIY